MFVPPVVFAPSRAQEAPGEALAGFEATERALERAMERRRQRRRDRRRRARALQGDVMEAGLGASAAGKSKTSVSPQSVLRPSPYVWFRP
jgi:hypothetical protein